MKLLGSYPSSLLVKMMKSQVLGINESFKRAGIGLNDILSVVTVTLEAVVMTIKEISQWLVNVFGSNLHEEIEDLTYFVPWDLERNLPKVVVETGGVSHDTIWIA